MAEGKSEPRAVNGIILLDKAPGETSNRSLQRVKRLFRARKAGHTGSLDPFATGMLPICLGSATKVSAYLLSASKEYRVCVTFGVSTDSADIDGRVLERRESPPPDRSTVEAVLTSFLGESQQIPPMYSAVKHAGRRLYVLARAGVEVERKPRRICIERIELDRLDWPELEFTVRCSKGTYIRSLAVDIAARLGTIGHVSALRRLAVDPFGRAALVSQQDLEAAAAKGTDELDSLLIGADRALQQFPAVAVDSAGQADLVHGRAAAATDPGLEGTLRVYGPGATFIGLAEAGRDGLLHPRRIFLP